MATFRQKRAHLPIKLCKISRLCVAPYSCYAMRTASRLQMLEVKEHLVIALTLLRSDKCGQNVEDIKTESKPLLSPVVVAPTVPLQNSEPLFCMRSSFPAME